MQAVRWYGALRNFQQRSHFSMNAPIKAIPHASHWGAFHAIVRGDRLVEARALPADPDPSPMLSAIPDMVHGTSRVGRPMVRQGWLKNRDRNRGADRFVEVPWDDALDLVAGELARVKAEHGNAAIFAGSYGWSSAGRFHHAKSQLQRFMNCYGGFTAQRHNYSYAAALALLPHVVGTVAASQGPVSSYDGIAQNTKIALAFGGLSMKNTQLDTGGIAKHQTADWLKQCAANGVRFVIVSPVRDDVPPFLAASGAAEWIPIRPNTDTAMMLALAHEILANGLEDTAFLDRYCVGATAFRSYVMGETDGVAKTPAWAAAITGVPAERIASLAREIVSVRSMLTASWALQRADHGEQPFWMLIALASLVGQIGLPGGGFGFGYASTGGQGVPRSAVTSPALPMGTNPTGSFIPVARIADMLMNPGVEYDFDGQRRVFPDTRMVYWSGGNPFHHHQDLNRLAQAFHRPECIVVHEPFWTATARHADIVLPATTTLERNDIGAGARDRTWSAMHQAIPPVEQSRNDFDIFGDLSQRLGIHAEYTEGRDELGWVRHLYEVAAEKAAAKGVKLPSFEQFWAEGGIELPMPTKPYTMFEDFRIDPDGSPLGTPTGRIEIFSERIASFEYDDCPGHPVWIAPKEWLGNVGQTKSYPLHMISNQPRTRLHGQNDPGGPSRASKIRGREPIWLHPDDAGARQIEDGQIVRVFNDRGAVLAGAVVTDRVMPGVVQLATGAWYDPTEPGGLDKHGNANVLTRDEGTSKLGQGPSSHSALVQVERYFGNLPPITAWGPPQP
jgi:biotin/methionine sulfoxide reductase